MTEVLLNSLQSSNQPAMPGYIDPARRSHRRILGFGRHVTLRGPTAARLLLRRSALHHRVPRAR